MLQPRPTPRRRSILTLCLLTGLFVSLVVLATKQGILERSLTLINKYPISKLQLFNDSSTNNDNGQRKKSIRLLCWVMTGPANHKARAIHVKATWGKRCDVLLFMSSGKDHSLPTVVLPGLKDSREYLWKKTQKAFEHVYDNYRDETDWYLKADDDTYVFVDNLKEFLSDKDPNDPTYYGAAVSLGGPSSAYMSGGAGYVLNRESLKRFVLTALKDDTGKLCNVDKANADEDVEMGTCMKNMGISLGDTLDEQGRPRFLPLSAKEHLNPGHSNSQKWYMKYSMNPKDGYNCCSSKPITFHYVEPQMMHVYEFLTHLKD